MPAPLIVVVGTGTGVGKTHVSCTLLSAWARRGRSVCGYKPIETGVVGDQGEDAAALLQWSSFHVNPYGATLRTPVSAHLAARREGRDIDFAGLLAEVARLRTICDGVVLECAGGLFSPLSALKQSSALFVQQLQQSSPAALLLVAPDRLGVLHDVIATTLAAASVGVVIDAIVLSAPEDRDDSTGTNADELATLVDVPMLGCVPRGEIADNARLSFWDPWLARTVEHASS